MTELFPKITIDINSQIKTLHKKGNSHGSSMIDYSKFQMKEPLITQLYNAAVGNNLSQVQGQLNTDQSKAQYNNDNKSSRRLLNNKLNNSIEIQQMQKQPKLSKERQNKTPKQGDQINNSYIHNTIDKDNLKYYTQLKEQESMGDNLSKKKSFLCQKLMDLLEKECTQFQEVISYINKVIKRYLICRDNVVIDKLRNLETYFNQSICFDKDFFTYPQLLNRVIDLSLLLNGKIENLQEQKFDMKAEIKSQMDKKEKENVQLETKYEKLKESFYIQLNSQIHQFKQKMEDLEKQNEILKSEKDKHTEQLTRIHENYDKVFYEKYSNYDQTLYEYKAIEKKYEIQNKDYNELKTQYNTIYDAYRKNMNDIKMFKEKNALNENKIQLLQQEINSLNADNQIYKQTYTPRPNLIEILEINKIEYDKEKKNTTQQLVLVLKNSLNGNGKVLSYPNNHSQHPLEHLPNNLIPISPLKQQQIPQKDEKKRGNIISLTSTMTQNNHNENQESNILQYSSQKSQSKRLSPQNQRPKQNISFIKPSKEVQKTESSNVSASDIKKQKKKIALDYGDPQPEQLKFQVIDKKKNSASNQIQDTLQKESKSLQIGDHIKKRVRSLHQKENFQNKSTLDISLQNKTELFSMSKLEDDNSMDTTLAEFSKRKFESNHMNMNNNDLQSDSKYNVRISQSQVYLDEEAIKHFQENFSPRVDNFDLINQQNNGAVHLQPKEKFLYYIKNRRKMQ